ncbi:MAG: hypothetical protein ACK5OG_04600, partial [Sphingomonadaceae bacterium]
MALRQTRKMQRRLRVSMRQKGGRILIRLLCMCVIVTNISLMRNTAREIINAQSDLIGPDMCSDDLEFDYDRSTW